MTAVDVDALDKLRDQLAAVLLFDCGLTESAHEARAAIDKLWPVVDRIANERAAAELRAAAAADDAQPTRWPGSSGEWLRARANALDGAHPCSGRFCRTCADEATS